MNSTATRLGLVTAVILGVTAALSFVALPALAAGNTTNIAFETVGPVEVDFGDEWVVTLRGDGHFVGEGGSWDRLLAEPDGTVDIFLSGIPEAFARSLPIQTGGLVFVSQPTNAPLLAAGSYQMTAVFIPASGSDLPSSQTPAPLALTLNAAEVSPAVELDLDASVSERPVIVGSLTGAYVNAAGGAPAGTWHFTVSDRNDEVVFDQESPQAQGESEAVHVEVTSRLVGGETYTLESEFVPVPELAGGLAVTAIPATEFQMPGGGLLDIAGSSVVLPPWLAILLLLLLIAAAAAVAELARKYFGRKSVPSTEDDGVTVTTPDAPIKVPKAAKRTKADKSTASTASTADDASIPDESSGR